MVPDDFPDIPDFLRRTGPSSAWKGKRLRWTREMTFTVKRKEEDPATRKLRREIEKAEEMKKKAAALRRKEDRQLAKRARS